MTAIVGIRCKDGVVIGADSSATFGGPTLRTIEQSTSRKIEIFGNSNPMIVAGTGFVGHHQRFVDVIKTANARGDLKLSKELDVARKISALGVQDFSETGATKASYSALVAYAVGQKPCLCELDGNLNFQPEIKMVDDLWFTSAGSGITITDPILALFKTVFWSDSAPDLRGGIFTAYWALHHACEVNPGGINHPIRIATLKIVGQKAEAVLLTDDQLEETKDLVESAIDHFRGFKDLLLGNAVTMEPPTMQGSAQPRV